MIKIIKFMTFFMSAQLMKMIDKILWCCVAFVLNHNYQNNFICTDDLDGLIIVFSAYTLIKLVF